MSQFYAICLPVKPHIKKYVQAIEGSTIEWKSNSMLCMIIRAYLENKGYTGRSKEELNTAINSRTDTLQISVPVKKMHVVGVHIRPDNIMLINRYLEDCFERSLHQFIQQSIKSNVRYQGFNKAYEAFATLYNIQLEEDISLDGIKKIDYRFRKKNQNIISHLVPSVLKPAQ